MVLQPASNTNDASYAGMMSNPFAMLTSGAYEVTPSGVDSKGIPASILLKSKSGAVYTIKILKYASFSLPDAALFTLDPNNYPTAIITDLR